jgi:hypothetical protein
LTITCLCSQTFILAESFISRQPGKNAPGLVSLTKQGSPVESPITGQETLTPEQSRQFAAGDWYISIHTQTHPDGEIRGLVLTPESRRSVDRFACSNQGRIQQYRIRAGNFYFSALTRPYFKGVSPPRELG